MDDGRTFTHLSQIFDRGLKVAGPSAPYIGHRPVVSAEPLKFADHFVWSTWGEVSKRRLDVGSGIEHLFRSGDAVKTNGLETVGVWSGNTPGECVYFTCSLSIVSASKLPSSSLHHGTSTPDDAFDALLTRPLTVVPAEWRILDLALSLYGKVLVPLYENFGPDSVGVSPTSSYVCFQPATQICLKSTCRFLRCEVIFYTCSIKP